MRQRISVSTRAVLFAGLICAATTVAADTKTLTWDPPLLMVDGVTPIDPKAITSRVYAQQNVAGAPVELLANNLTGPSIVVSKADGQKWTFWVSASVAGVEGDKSEPLVVLFGAPVATPTSTPTATATNTPTPAPTIASKTPTPTRTVIPTPTTVGTVAPTPNGAHSPATLADLLAQLRSSKSLALWRPGAKNSLALFTSDGNGGVELKTVVPTTSGSVLFPAPALGSDGTTQFGVLEIAKTGAAKWISNGAPSVPAGVAGDTILVNQFIADVPAIARIRQNSLSLMSPDLSSSQAPSAGGAATSPRANQGEVYFAASNGKVIVVRKANATKGFLKRTADRIAKITGAKSADVLKRLTKESVTRPFYQVALFDPLVDRSVKGPGTPIGVIQLASNDKPTFVSVIQPEKSGGSRTVLTISALSGKALFHNVDTGARTVVPVGKGLVSVTGGTFLSEDNQLEPGLLYQQKDGQLRIMNLASRSLWPAFKPSELYPGAAAQGIKLDDAFVVQSAYTYILTEKGKGSQAAKATARN